MRVRHTGYSQYGSREMDLCDALTPDDGNVDGHMERIRQLADNTAEAFGRLAAKLVEKRILSLDEAGELLDYYDLVEVPDDDLPF